MSMSTYVPHRREAFFMLSITGLPGLSEIIDRLLWYGCWGMLTTFPSPATWNLRPATCNSWYSKFTRIPANRVGQEAGKCQYWNFRVLWTRYSNLNHGISNMQCHFMDNIVFTFHNNIIKTLLVSLININNHRLKLANVISAEKKQGVYCRRLLGLVWP